MNSKAWRKRRDLAGCLRSEGGAGKLHSVSGEIGIGTGGEAEDPEVGAGVAAAEGAVAFA